MFADIKKHKALILFLACFSLLIIVILNIFFVNKLELMAFDWRSQWRKVPADPNIVCVVVDDYSLKKLSKKTKEGFGRWPWPRPSYSKLLKAIAKGDPKLIVVDITLDRDSIEYKNPEFNQEQFIEDLKNIPNLFFVHSITLQEKDFELYNSKKYNKIFKSKEKLNQYKNKMKIEFLKAGPGSLIDKFDYSSIINDNVRNIPAIQKYIKYYNMPIYIDAIYQYAQGIGINNAVKDEDDTFRSIQPLYLYENRYLFSIHLAVASFIKGDKRIIELNPYQLKFGDTIIPLTKLQTFYFNWRDKVKVDKEILKQQVYVPEYMHYKSVLAYDLLFNDGDKLFNTDVFKDKIVILGVTANAMRDFFKVPNNNMFFGVETIATGIDNLLNDKGFLYRLLDWQNWLITVFLVLLIILFYFVSPVSKSYQTSVTYSLLVLVLYIGLNLYLFVTFSIWIDLVNPLLCSIITIISLVSVTLIIEKDKRTLIERTFSKYVSPQIYQQLVSSCKDVSLDTYRDNITVLFSDIRGFTPFTEDLTPEEVSVYLNEYFTEMVEVILKHNGTIDKFMGDAIMAFFGAPVYSENHASQAAHAALEMMAVLERLNSRWSAQGKRLLEIGVGINSGTALIGNFGSPRLMDFTVIGDTVNLAARLESLNKETGTNILISAFTYQQIKNQARVNIIGPKTVKGKSESVVVYELLGFES